MIETSTYVFKFNEHYCFGITLLFIVLHANLNIMPKTLLLNNLNENKCSRAKNIG